MSKALQFYGRRTRDGVRGILSFKVESKGDAIRGLDRFNIPAGWYVEKHNGKVVKNEKISNSKYVVTREETIFDKIDKFLQL